MTLLADPAPAPATPGAPPARGPRYPEVGVLGLVPDTWGGVWMPRHQVLTRLADYFRVVWCDQPREWRRFWLPWAARPVPPDVNAAVPPAPGFTIYRPGRWLPRVYRPRPLARLLDRLRPRRAAALLRRQGARRIVLYLWRPELAAALDLVPHELACYHIDDEYTFADVEQPQTAAEAALIGRVDRVFIHSPALLEKKGHLNQHTAFVPNGVDYTAFATPTREPADLAPLPRPRIGYVGMIKDELDLPLLTELAAAHRDWSFVLVGPSRADAGTLRALAALPNVHLLGGKPVAELPGYVQHLDVCLLPYRVTGYTKFIYPLKLHEYLAAGRPVVGSPIRTLHDFPRVVTLAETKEQWSAAIAAALAPAAGAPAAVAERQRIAQEHDWNHLVTRIAAAIAAGLGLPQ